MITAYARTPQGVTHAVASPGSAPLANAVWIDLKDVDAEALAFVSHLLHLKIPQLREVRLLDQASQLYHDKGALHLVLPLIVRSQSESPTAASLHFILTEKVLITLREGESHAFQNFVESLGKRPHLLDHPAAVFTGLVSAIVSRMADLGETVAYEMDQVSRLVFQESLQRSKAPGRGKPDSWRRVLQGLGRTARLNHRLITSLSSFERMLAYVSDPKKIELPRPEREQLLMLQHDSRRLLEQANATVNEATFLLDAIASAISIEQNNVIKIFSMVAVVLMPPTMVASIYGMNFVHMPELGWIAGYPLALLLMIVSAILPVWWFKRHGWF